jgi:hypothetical protein
MTREAEEEVEAKPEGPSGEQTIPGAQKPHDPEVADEAILSTPAPDPSTVPYQPTLPSTPAAACQSYSRKTNPPATRSKAL